MTKERTVQYAMHYLLVTDDKGTRIMCEGEREQLEKIARDLHQRRPSLSIRVTDCLDNPPLANAGDAGAAHG
jgi:hypothetical protein